MIKSFSLMTCSDDLVDQFRKKLHGSSATASDYKRSFVIGEIVDLCTVDPEELMAPDISSRDSILTKAPQSINLRAATHEKVTTYARVLNISDSEALRRFLIWYSLRDATSNSSISGREEKINCIREQLLDLKRKHEDSITVISNLLVQIDLLGRMEEGGMEDA